MKERENEYLPHSSGCLLCGDENICGVRTRFFVERDTVKAKLILPHHVNGYREIAHGGILAGLLDESMGWAATVFGKEHLFYVTGELTIKYLAPVPVEKEIEIYSRLLKDAGRIAYSEGELLHNNKVCVLAKGKFSPMSAEATTEVTSYLKFDQCHKYRTLFGRLKEKR